MKKFIIFICALFMLALSSCGPSAEEIQGIHESISLANAELNGLNEQLIQYRANLESANDQMIQIKEWQFGRTSAEREEQITNQSVYIQKLESEISRLETEVGKSESYIAELEIQLDK